MIDYLNHDTKKVMRFNMHMIKKLLLLECHRNEKKCLNMRTTETTGD
jgi:hypothetical protein